MLCQVVSMLKSQISMIQAHFSPSVPPPNPFLPVMSTNTKHLSQNPFSPRIKNQHLLQLRTHQTATPSWPLLASCPRLPSASQHLCLPLMPNGECSLSRCAAIPSCLDRHSPTPMHRLFIALPTINQTSISYPTLDLLVKERPSLLPVLLAWNTHKHEPTQPRQRYHFQPTLSVPLPQKDFDLWSPLLHK